MFVSFLFHMWHTSWFNDHHLGYISPDGFISLLFSSSSSSAGCVWPTTWRFCAPHQTPLLQQWRIFFQALCSGCPLTSAPPPRSKQISDGVNLPPSHRGPAQPRRDILQPPRLKWARGGPELNQTRQGLYNLCVSLRLNSITSSQQTWSHGEERQSKQARRVSGMNFNVSDFSVDGEFRPTKRGCVAILLLFNQQFVREDCPCAWQLLPSSIRFLT